MQKTLCLERSYDVVVVGGGITGCCAALSAARNGAKTAIVELSGFLGGVAASAGKFPWNGFINYQEKEYVVRGIPLEIANAAAGGEAYHHIDPVMESLTDVDGPMLRIVLADILDEAGVDIYFHSIANMPLMDGTTVVGVYIQCRQGLGLLRAKAVVDAGDSADIAIEAGADYIRGQEGTHKTQIASGMMLLGNIDMDALITEIERKPKEVRPREFSESELEYVIRSLRESQLSCIGTFREQIKKAKQDGLRLPERDIVSGTIYPQSRKLLTVISKVAGVDPRDICNISRAEVEAYKQFRNLYKMFREYVPGCENAVLESVSTQIGIRETVHVRGEYWLTAQDLLDGTIFPDTIATGSYIMDVHSPDHGSVDPCVELPTYAIPYRSLVPLKIDGLLMAGRCISASHEAMSAFRVIPIAAATGEAAGAAAAMCCLKHCQPRHLNPQELRQNLIAAGCEIGQNRN